MTQTFFIDRDGNAAQANPQNTYGYCNHDQRLREIVAAYHVWERGHRRSDRQRQDLIQAIRTAAKEMNPGCCPECGATMPTCCNGRH